MSYDHWDLMLSGKIDSGLRQVQEMFNQHQNASRTMELGVAYLLAEHYDSALEHFEMAIDNDHRTKDCYYVMAGIAKWCLGQQAEAVAHWKTGLQAKYAGTAGLGVQIPLLLFLASTLQPTTYNQAQVISILKKKTKDQRIKYWPGPIARLILDRISESELDAQCKARTEGHISHLHWTVDFYKALVGLYHNNAMNFGEAMQELTRKSNSQFSNKDFLLGQLWSGEYFIARYESRLNQTGRL